jgi:hypothetical protein
VQAGSTGAFMKPTSLNRQQLTLLGAVFTAIALIGYIWFYQFQPFGDFVDQLALNIITVLCALVCAIVLTLISTFYERGEPSRIIWINFALALWMWTIGEIIWAIYNMAVGEVPIVSLADGVWILGYVFFTIAISTQYRLVMFNKSNKPILIAVGVWIFAVLLTLAILILTMSQSFSEEFLTYFYPVGDFVIGLSSVILVIVFHRGALARPWLGLFVFALSDGLYAWAIISGVYAYEPPSGNLITLIVDLTYILAYLAVAWGAFQQYLTLRFGAVIPGPDTKPLWFLRK